MSSLCIACGEPLSGHLESVIDPDTRDRFSIGKCASCGLGHTLPVPESMDRYYGQTYYGGRHGFSALFCAKRRTRLVSSIMGKGRNRALLDVGCGDGAFLLEIGKTGWQCVGTERNPALAREVGLTVEETIDAAKSAGPFDCVTSWHSFEHISDPLSLLAEISHVLRPSGRFIIGVPDFGGLQAKLFRHKWLHLDVPRHLYHYDDGALSHLLKQAGFEVTHRYHQEFEYDLMGWVQSALNFMLPKPNFFFNLISGKQSRGSASVKLLHSVLGAILSLVSLPAVALGTLLGKGGTLIVVAKHAGRFNGGDVNVQSG